MALRTAWALLTSGLCASLLGCAGARPLVIGHPAEIRSQVLGEARPLAVYLPDSYETQPSRRYPVIFVLDGEAHFRNAVGTVDLLAYGAANDGIPEHIVVAVPNVGASRGRDFSVYDRPADADRFLAFLEAELVPYIDGSYRTHPYRILSGHSASGTFALHVMLRGADVFQAYIVASGAWRGSPGEPGERLFSEFRSRGGSSTFLYSTRGDELPSTVETYDRWIGLLESAGEMGLAWQSQRLPSEVHMTTSGVTLHHGLRALYADTQASALERAAEGGVDDVEAYFARLAESKYGYAIWPEAAIRQLAFAAANRGDIDTAMAFLERNVGRFPGSIENHRLLAIYLQRAGRLEEAMQTIEHALALADRDPSYTSRFLLESVQERLGAARGGDS